MIKNPHINAKFQREVESHIFSNYLIRDTDFPLILGVFGPPGEGKTFQIEQLCKDLHVDQIIVGPGELESENAGYPAQLLRKLYLEAGSSQSTNTTNKAKVIIINDIDTVLGNWGKLVQYTVNRQVLFGQLMAFCDFPTTVNRCSTKRIPIIITGNNPAILYPPLLRAGRMRILHWQPTLNEKLPIIQRIFPYIPEKELGSLLNLHPTQPVSFWSDLYSRIQENALMDWIEQQPKLDLIAHLQRGDEFSFPDPRPSLGIMQKTAAELSKSYSHIKTYAPVTDTAIPI